jgi:hypothetical protein
VPYEGIKMHITSTADILAARFERFEQANLHNTASIETNVGITTNTTSIELPQEITSLITGSPYWVLAKTNRYKKLIREGHLSKLMRLASEALTKDNPANWFARAASKARWERYTLPYLSKLREVAEKAERVARRLNTHVTKFIYQQIWRGVNVERWAIQAEEMRHDRPNQSKMKHFAWLCLNEKAILTGRSA